MDEYGGVSESMTKKLGTQEFCNLVRRGVARSRFNLKKASLSPNSSKRASVSDYYNRDSNSGNFRTSGVSNNPNRS